MSDETREQRNTNQTHETCESLIVLLEGDLTILMLIKTSNRSVVVRNSDNVDQRFDHTIHEVGVLEIVNAAQDSFRAL